jgi:hypothetical protein
LDPVWNLQALRDHAGSDIHTAFLRVARDLFRQDDNDDDEFQHPLSSLQPAIEHALICIIDTIAGPNTAEFVDEFLEEFIPQVKIPRLPGYD